MPATQHPIIAREGWLAMSVVAAAGALLYAMLGSSAAAPALVLLGVMLYLYRDPSRESDSVPLALVSPLDGKIAIAGEGYDPWLGREGLRIEVRAGLLDVHSIFAPTEGKLVEHWTRPRHAREGAPPRHRCVAYHFRTDEGDDVVMEIVKGIWNGPVRFRPQPGERVGHARRVGFAPLGCNIIMHVPAGSRIDVTPGDRAVGANTVLSTFVHEKAVSSLAEPGEG